MRLEFMFGEFYDFEGDVLHTFDYDLTTGVPQKVIDILANDECLPMQTNFMRFDF